MTEDQCRLCDHKFQVGDSLIEHYYKHYEFIPNMKKAMEDIVKIHYDGIPDYVVYRTDDCNDRGNQI